MLQRSDGDILMTGSRRKFDMKHMLLATAVLITIRLKSTLSLRSMQDLPRRSPNLSAKPERAGSHTWHG